MHAGAHRAFRAWRTAGNGFEKDERVEPKRRRGVAIGKKEVEGPHHPCKLPNFTFYTSN